MVESDKFKALLNCIIVWLSVARLGYDSNHDQGDRYLHIKKKKLKELKIESRQCRYPT